MGHAIFIVLHILCCLFGFIGLIVTIPLHLIYAAVSGKNKKEVVEKNLCPDCGRLTVVDGICSNCSYGKEK